MAASSSDLRLPEGSFLYAASADMRQGLLAVAHRRLLPSGEILFREGEPGDSFYLVQRGEIEISVHAADGRKLSLDVIREGEGFGEIALFGGNRTATARALRKSALLAVRRADALALLRQRPELALEFIDILCARLRDLSGKLEERAFAPVPVRLASRLLYLDRKLGDQGRVAVSQAELANFVGATREGVAKVLATWRSHDWVALSRGSVRIVDRAALERVRTESIR
ncbi:MAG: Crp/Fnr family transcriptional regulator [Amaricoccus sp.]